MRVVEGNYAAYQYLVGRRLAGTLSESSRRCEQEKSPGAEKQAPQATGETKPPRRKRRFPYRKVDDLEREIFEREARVHGLHALLAEPETLRDGDRVRQLKAELADQQQALEALYAHWEEATELNR